MASSKIVSRSTQTLIDRLAIGAAIVCALHCTVLPVVLVFLPSLLHLSGHDHRFHLVLLFLVVPLGVLGALHGYIRHRDGLVAIGIAAGLLTVTGALIFGENFLGEIGERYVTVMGSLMLAAAHYRNITLCQQEHCCEHC